MPTITEVYALGNFIDTFALGHYARVLEAHDLRDGRQVALKIMRPEHIARDEAPRWEAKAFPHEVRLLKNLDRNPVPIRYYDCGYIQSSNEYPDGEIISLRTDWRAFEENLFPRNSEGWRPYIALEYLPREQNLLYVMKTNNSGQRRRLPIEEGLNLAMQFGHMLLEAHENYIFYMDHKLEHVYWDGKKLRVIDWNSSKQLEQHDAQINNLRRKDLHNLCVGILYPIFTGMSPQRGELRPQPASQQEVDTRYNDVTHLDFSGEMLSQPIIDLLERGAHQDFANAEEFLQTVEQAAVHFGWVFRFQVTHPALIQAREYVRNGLSKLRESAELAREARDLLTDAAILEGINEDMELELRRLMKAINDYLNMRVIP
ncbi:MAG: hypothetical protein CUN55_01170 [Phototrophicales bacterium]|nr:MAG: hypothetical protein CUN55_01170 [Phototrophicales bacterium]